jgi:hypothetical protein
MRISIVDVGDEPVLAGAANGRKKFVSLLGQVETSAKSPVPLFLDFYGAEVATASFLRESVFALKSYLRSQASTHYAVVANANEVILEELSTIAKAIGDVILTCDLDEGCRVSEIHLIGDLDPKQHFTFQLVQKLKETDANTLMDQFGEAEQTKSSTAWNNRLSSLANKGIIREYTRGRAKSYRPVLEVSGSNGR